jgi:hypothetical protein
MLIACLDKKTQSTALQAGIEAAVLLGIHLFDHFHFYLLRLGCR